MSIARDRKEASKRLGLALSKKYERLVTAGSDKDEITLAAIDLGNCFNENIEFVLWVLKTYGGMTVSPPTRHFRAPPVVTGIDLGTPGGDHSAEVLMQDGKVIGSRTIPANDLPEMPALFAAGRDVDAIANGAFREHAGLPFAQGSAPMPARCICDPMDFAALGHMTTCPCFKPN